MWSSLFGELSLLRGRSRAPGWQATRVPPGHNGFAVTAILETADTTAADDEGRSVDRLVREMVVSGSPVEAMRSHFSAHGDTDYTSQAIALHDPTAACAASIVRLLSHAGHEPIERVQMRERATLRSLATVERTRATGRGGEALKVYHADVPVDDPECAEVPLVLMERADMAAIVVGTMHPDSVTLMLQMLQHACLQPTWRCPRLLFAVPPGASVAAATVLAQDWPEAMRVDVRECATDDAAAVWHEVLDWAAARASAPWAPATPLGAVRWTSAPADGAGSHEVMPAPERTGVRWPSAAPEPQATAPVLSPALTSSVHPSVVPLETVGAPAVRTPAFAAAAKAGALLRSLLEHDGVLACAICDAASGGVVARESRDAHLVDIDAAAMACAQAMRTHRLSARTMGLGETLSELTVIAGARQQLVRMLARQPGFFIFVLVDRTRANVSLIRYRLIEADKAPRAT